MFDIGFFELLIIAVVGLFVIGPERLPGTIRTCALWLGRIKRNVLDTRRELEKHIGADEIRRELHNEQIMHNLAKLKDTKDELENKIKKWESGEAINEDEPNPHGVEHSSHETDESTHHHSANEENHQHEEPSKANEAFEPAKEPEKNK